MLGQLLDRKASFCSAYLHTRRKQWESYWLVMARRAQLAKQNSKPRLATVLLGIRFWTSVYPFVRLKGLLVLNFDC